MSVQPASRPSFVVVRLLVVSSVVLIATIASSAFQPSPRVKRPDGSAMASAAPSARVSSTRLKPRPQDEVGLASKDRLDLSSLLGRLKAGEEFSAEERDVLLRYESGAEIAEVEAQTVISRALYLYYIKVEPLSDEQQKLFDAYAAFTSGQINVADPKHRDGVFRQSNPAGSIATAPPNDNCSAAELIPGAGPFPYLTTTIDITDATTVGDPAAIPSCTFGGGPVSRSVWYTFTPTTTGNYTIASCPAAPTATTIQDTVMGIYTSAGGCGGPFTELPTNAGAGTDGCDDDTCAAPLQSIITTNLTSGTQYYVLVYLFGTAPPAAGQSSLQLRVSQTVAPSNDLCSGAVPLTLGVPAIGSINTLTGNDYSLTIGAPTCFTGLAQTGNAAAGRDVVYSFVPPTTGAYSFIYSSLSTAGSPNAILYLTAASTSCPAPGALSCIATNVASGTITDASNRNTTTNLGSEAIGCKTLTAGSTYYIFVDALAVAAATFTFSLEARQCFSEAEPNNTPATANAIVCGIQGAMNAASDINYYSIGTPVAGSKVFAMADGASSSNNDFRMRVTTTTDTIEFDDDDLTTRWGANSPTIAGRSLTAVPTFLSVNHFTAATVTEPYRLYYVLQPPGSGLAGSSATPESEPNDLIGQEDSAQNNYFSGDIGAAADLDTYIFAATAGDVVFISLDTDPLRNGTNFAAGLFLFDPTLTQVFGISNGNITSNTTVTSGNLLATSPASPAEGAVITIPVSGNYIVGVNRQSGGTPGPTLDYLLSISKACTVPTPNVAITKTGPASIPCNTTITYTLTASNIGDVNATNALVTDDLPDCLTGVGVTSSAGTFSVGAGNVVTGTIPTLSPGSPVTITITGTVPAACGASISNQAAISATGDTTPGNNTSATVTTTITTTSACSLLPSTASHPVNTSHTVTVTVTQCGAPQSGQSVNFAVTGRNTTSGSGTTNASGQATFTYTDTGSAIAGGTDTLTSTVVSSGSTCMATVDWVTTACVLTCPANITQPNNANQCGAVVTYSPPSSTGNCGTIACSPASGSFFPVGSTTVTCTSQSGSSCTFTVTVQDTQAPAVTCPANITQANTAGQCSGVVSYTTPTGTDNCPGPVNVSCSPASGSAFPVGVTTVTCTAADASANSPDATCTFTVTVQDTQAPAVTCPANITQANTAGQCSGVVSYTTPTGTDNCPGPVTVSCSPASGSAFPVGVTTVTCTAADASANSPDATCTFTVTVQDTQAPAVTCPANITQPNTAGQCSRLVTYTTPTGTDNCPGTVTVSCSPASGSSFPVGVTTVTCTAADASANSPDATCTFTVTIQDAQAPTIACPANITQPTAAGQCSAAVIYTASATDNCAGVSIVCSPASGSTFPVGTTTVGCTATDASANTASCSFTITVQDTQAPVITCPANVTVASTSTMACAFSTVVSYPAPTVTDNCGVGTVACVPPSGSTFQEGTTTVTCTATDTGGNTAACTFTVTVGASFGFCSVDDATGDWFQLVVEPASQAYGVWRYTVVATNTTYCGRANFVSYIPGAKLRAYDNDFSRENPTFVMDATYKGVSGTVTVRNVSGTIRLTLRDRNLLDSLCQ